MRRVHGVPVFGVSVDPQTRCAHYDTQRDVVALRFACCDRYYPCFRCHEAVADHEPTRIPRAEFDQHGVLCGVCGTELTVSQYRDCDDACPACEHAFNPGCSRHADRYFAVDSEGE
ncbi:CHY zinc finger protein [Haloarchaeobius sp. DT45]|uniref:CHY zinc finger protein n=1 Tax=Haloarchaeobius sp. DT45 TaxID=3446116 RepID=UPI003F6D8729